MISPGLCSVTLRSLDAVEVIDVVRRAGLECVEWGGDVHVPPGDAVAAEEVRSRCADAGVRVASYGSYFRAGVHEPADARAVIDTAVALGAPRVRIWAGDVGSGDADQRTWAAVVDAVRAITELAGDCGVQVGLEFHRGTLTDTAEATVRLVGEIGAAITTYWQPPVALDDAAALAGLRTVAAHVSALHVFSWSPTGARLALAQRESLWQQAFSAVADDGIGHDALLEFVADDDPHAVLTDAATLRQLLGSPASGAHGRQTGEPA